MELSFIYHTKNSIIYGTGSLIILMFLLALIKNLFCRKKKKDPYDFNKRYALNKRRCNSENIQKYHSNSKINKNKNTKIQRTKSDDTHNHHHHHRNHTSSRQPSPRSPIPTFSPFSEQSKDTDYGTYVYTVYCCKLFLWYMHCIQFNLFPFVVCQIYSKGYNRYRKQ